MELNICFDMFMHKSTNNIINIVYLAIGKKGKIVYALTPAKNIFAN